MGLLGPGPDQSPAYSIPPCLIHQDHPQNLDQLIQRPTMSPGTSLGLQILCPEPHPLQISNFA